MNLSERELTILNQVGLEATQLLEIEDILALAIDTFINKLGMAVANIYLRDQQSGRYISRVSQGLTDEQIERLEHHKIIKDDLTQQVVDTGEEVFVPDISQDSRFDDLREEAEDRSYVKMPMFSRGTVVGVVGLVAPVTKPLTPRSIEFLKAIGRVIGIAIDNATLLAETRRRGDRAIAHYNLGIKVSASLSLSGVLEAIAEASRELMCADIGLVALVDGAQQHVVIETISGDCINSLSGYQKVDPNLPLWKNLLNGEQVYSDFDDGLGQSLHEDEFICDERVQTYLAAPLMRGNIFLGLIEVMYREERRLNQDDMDSMTRLANQAVLSIENAQLYRQMHHMAGLEERDRLARELHDNLSQGLGYLKIKASITEDLMASGDINKAKESLKELKKVSEHLYIDVREEIFKLRTVVQERMGFFATLQDYLADYRTHYGLRVDLVIENECLTDFSPQISSQLLRIIQEALTNVRKHSAAGKVLLHCTQGGDQICVCIEDYGQGFHLSEDIRANGQHYGLQIMKERAESVGGSLELETEPGKGTRVIVCVPAELAE